MLDLGDDLPKNSVSSRVSEHGKTDQLIAVIGSNQIFTEEITRKLLLDRLKVLAVVPKSPTLPNGRLVENFSHPVDECIVVACLAHFDAALLRFAEMVPGVGLDLFVPPVIEARHGQGSYGLPFLVKVESGLNIREPLPEGEDFGPDARLPKGGNHRFRIRHVLVPLILELHNCCRPS